MISVRHRSAAHDERGGARR